MMTLLSSVGTAITGTAARGPMIAESSGMPTSGNPKPIVPLMAAAPAMITEISSSRGPSALTRR